MFVLCTLPNASVEIGGIKFELCQEGMVSTAEVDEPEASRLGKIAGYKLIDAKAAAALKKAATKAADAKAAE